jgi:phosphate transport system substrate-binding protein
VAIISAAAIGLLLGGLSTNISRLVNIGDIGGQSSMKLSIAGSSVMHPINQLIAGQYMASHPGVNIDVQGGGNVVGAVAVDMGITDIGALSQQPTADELAVHSQLIPVMVGGRAIVLIAHDDLSALTTTGVSQSDLQSVYSQSKQTLSPILSGVTTAVRNTDNNGSEEILAGWLTDGQSTTLDGYTATPDGVTMVNALGNSEVFSFVSSTPGAIGYIDWLYVSGNNPGVSHVNVLPIVDKANGQFQAPGVNTVMAEINNMDNNSYDSGLVNRLYYVTNGEPVSLAGDYIKYAMSPGTIGLYHQAGAYSVLELA